MSFGLSAAAVGLIGAGTGLVTGMMGANAASDAADTQAASADRATALQKQMFDKQVELQAPFRDAGLAAQNRLMYLLGLPTSGGGASGGSSAAPLDANALRAQLIGQYTSAGTPGGFTSSGGGEGGQADYYQPGSPGAVDEAGLQAEINRRMAAQSQGGAPAPGVNLSNDPAFGSLMQDAPDPGKIDIHPFTMSDYQADPGYAFRLQQGQQALERSAASRGGLFSGRAAKDIMGYAQGQASQEYGNAYNRYNTDQQNQVNAFNTNYQNALNRFQVNRANKLNPLQSLMGAGQTSANTIGGAAQAYGTQAGSNMMGAGNAQAAAGIAQSNSLQNGFNGAMSGLRNSSYQTQPVNFAGSSGGNALFPEYGSASGATGAWL